MSENNYPIWHPFTPWNSQPPLKVGSGKDATLFLEDGSELIDAIGSWWVCLHGHSNIQISEAIAKQAQKLEQVILAGFIHEPAYLLAQKLLEVLPKNFGKIFFSDDGSTAIEVAIKMALQYLQLKEPNAYPTISALEGAYHGDTFGAMSVAERSPFSAAFTNRLFQASFLPLTPCNDPFIPLRDADFETLDAFDNWAKNGGKIFIYEPIVQGASGMRFWPISLLQALLQKAKEYQVLTIADEVMTGFGRLGPLFASEWAPLKPDFICLSKALTGGYLPMGVTACHSKIFDAFKGKPITDTFFHGHSFTGNPLACAAALASLQLLLQPQVQLQAESIALRHQYFANKISKHKACRAARNLGIILAIEIETGIETDYFHEARSRYYQFAIDRGVLLRPLGNVVYLLPPLSITPNQLSQCYQTIQELLNQVADGKL